MKYTLNPKNIKHTCPQCGSRKSFKRYIDTETGQDLDPRCGRCDHLNRCQYHYTPKQLFTDFPHLRPTSSSHAMPPVTAGPYRAMEPPSLQQQEFFSMAWVEAAMHRHCTFAQWIKSLPFDPDRVAEVLQLYAIGGTAGSVVKDGIDYGPAVVFWMIDELNRVHDAKLLAYTPDGHRVQDWSNSMRSICQKSGKGPQLDHTDKVLFGLHLVSRNPDATIAIVESEKTAILCAIQWPEYIWLATGGCGNLQPHKLAPLMHRRLVLFPDSGQLQKWQHKMADSGHTRYTFDTSLENHPPNTDIADLLLDAVFSHAKAQSHPVPYHCQGTAEIGPQKPQECATAIHTDPADAQSAFDAMAARNPALLTFSNMLGFEPKEATQE